MFAWIKRPWNERKIRKDVYKECTRRFLLSWLASQDKPGKEKFHLFSEFHKNSMGGSRDGGVSVKNLSKGGEIEFELINNDYHLHEATGSTITHWNRMEPHTVAIDLRVKITQQGRNSAEGRERGEIKKKLKSLQKIENDLSVQAKEKLKEPWTRGHKIAAVSAGIAAAALAVTIIIGWDHIVEFFKPDSTSDNSQIQSRSVGSLGHGDRRPLPPEEE